VTFVFWVYDAPTKRDALAPKLEVKARHPRSFELAVDAERDCDEGYEAYLVWEPNLVFGASALGALRKLLDDQWNNLPEYAGCGGATRRIDIDSADGSHADCITALERICG